MKKTGEKNTVKGKEKEIAKRSLSSVVKNLPVGLMNFEADRDAGFEMAGRDAYAVPFLIVLQTNSPQCAEDQGAYVKGAKPGMFLNTATKELYDGKKGVVIVPASYQHKFTEWVPRDQGGGYRGEHLYEDVDTTVLKRDPSGKFLLDNGDVLVDTCYHFCLHLTEQGPRMIVLALSSTQLKKSRNWMTLMKTIKLEGKGGGKFTPPMFSHSYKLTTVTEANDKGTWKGVMVELDHQLNPTSEVDTYELAKQFSQQIRSNKAKAAEPSPQIVEGDAAF